MAKILVVDDDPGIRESTKMILECEGHQVETAADDVHIEQLQKDSPDVIILDIWLGDKHGGEITKKLKSRPDTKHIPVILFSAHREIQHIKETCGADDYLMKPFSIDQLLGKVSKFVAHKKGNVLGVSIN